jgi:hypothetical protein
MFNNSGCRSIFINGGINYSNFASRSTVENVIVNSTATIFSSAFSDTYRLQSCEIHAPAINLTSAFQNSRIGSLIMSNCANVINTSFMFRGCFALRKLIMSGLTVSIDVSGLALQAQELNDFANSLGMSINTSQIINISRNPGALTCDHSLFTLKNYQLITV